MNLEDDSSTDLQPGFDRYIYGLACEKYLHLNADRRSWFRSYEHLVFCVANDVSPSGLVVRSEHTNVEWEHLITLIDAEAKELRLVLGELLNVALIGFANWRDEDERSSPLPPTFDHLIELGMACIDSPGPDLPRSYRRPLH